MGQGIGQMVLTEICHVTELDPALFVFEAADTARTPDSGTSTASRQTVMTGEAARRVGEKLKMALSGGKTIADLEGQEFFGEYSAKTDPLGAIKENPISHVSYSYGAQVIILNEQGRIEKAVSAFDVGTPVNVQSVEGQIEGGMVMGIGYGVTEKFECVDGYPKSKFGTIGFMRATEAPELEVILCQPDEKINCRFAGSEGLRRIVHDSHSACLCPRLLSSGRTISAKLAADQHALSKVIYQIVQNEQGILPCSFS